jgi:hypothetical protein
MAVGIGEERIIIRHEFGNAGSAERCDGWREAKAKQQRTP